MKWRSLLTTARDRNVSAPELSCADDVMTRLPVAANSCEYFYVRPSSQASSTGFSPTATALHQEAPRGLLSSVMRRANLLGANHGITFSISRDFEELVML